MEELKELVDLAERLDKTGVGQLLAALAPIVKTNSQLIDLGVQSLIESKSRVEAKPAHWSLQQIEEELDISRMTSHRYRKKYDWFVPEFGKGRGQRFSDEVVNRLREIVEGDKRR